MIGYLTEKANVQFLRKKNSSNKNINYAPVVMILDAGILESHICDLFVDTPYSRG